MVVFVLVMMFVCWCVIVDCGADVVGVCGVCYVVSADADGVV